MKRVITVVLLLQSFMQVHSQDSLLRNDTPKSARQFVFSYAFGAQYGFIFAHSQAVQNTKGANPFGMEFILSWQRNDSSTWNLCNCYPRKGLLLAYYNYDTEILGHGAIAGYFLEPVYKLGRDLFFSFQGSAGLGYLTSPYHDVHNPTNQSYSTRMNVYLLIGLGLWYRINNHWSLNTSINYQHVSNGGLREPNKGINWPTAGIKLGYTPRPVALYRGRKVIEKYWKGQSPRYDIGLFGMARRGVNDHGEKQRMALVGLQLQASKQVARINAITAGIELVVDQKIKQQLKRDSIDASSLRIGLLAGHEFLLGKFIFSQRLGVYLLDQTPYFDRLFHSWGLHYRFASHWGVGVNLKAHRHIAEYADFRVVYSF